MWHVLHDILIQIADAIAQSNVIALLLTLIIFWQLGDRSIREEPHLRKTGQHSGVGVFFAYLAWDYQKAGMPFDFLLLDTVLRALISAGYWEEQKWVLGIKRCRRDGAGRSSCSTSSTRLPDLVLDGSSATTPEETKDFLRVAERAM